jgi:hypothetical protein
MVQTITARPQTAPAAHPLASSVAAVDRSVAWMSFVLEDVAGPGWLRCEQVLRDPDFFTGWRAAVARHLAERHGTVPDRTPAGYVLQWYLRIPAYTGAMLFHSARRVPALEPRRLAFRLDPAEVETTALRPGPFWCLPTDPDARHPTASGCRTTQRWPRSCASRSSRTRPVSCVSTDPRCASGGTPSGRR